MTALSAAQAASATYGAVPTTEARSRFDLPISWGFPGHDAIAVDEPFDQLLPTGGLAGGQLIAINGATSLALALLARPSRDGRWCALIGAPTVGLAAARELSVDLDRLLLVPRPADRFREVLTALIDAVDVVAFQLPPSLPAALVRQLTARARTRNVPLVAFSPASPGDRNRSHHSTEVDGAAVRLSVRHRWSGLGQGHGHLRQRQLHIHAVGRGRAARPINLELALPAAPTSASTTPTSTALTPTTPASASTAPTPTALTPTTPAPTTSASTVPTAS